MSSAKWQQFHLSLNVLKDATYFMNKGLQLESVQSTSSRSLLVYVWIMNKWTTYNIPIIKQRHNKKYKWIVIKQD